MLQHPTMGIYLPSDFPISMHAAVDEEIARTAPLYDAEATAPEPRRLFVGGWSAIAYRFRATHGHGNELRKTIDRYGDAPRPSIRVRQEQSLHDFFANGLSCLESFAFASYQIGALKKATAFPVSATALREVKLSLVKKKFEKNWPGNRVSSAISDLRRDSSFREWTEVRNITTHRVVPSRRICIGGGASAFAFSRAGGHDLELTTTEISNRRMWLVGQLSSLISAVHDFVLSPP